MLDKKNLLALSEKQRQLDQFIYQNHHLFLTPELTQKKMMAFFVELGEYANEERSFKYWSEKLQAPRQRQLDEYIDGLHFLLSLGNDFDYDFNDFDYLAPKTKSIIEQYFDVIHHFNSLLSLTKAASDRQLIKNIYPQLLNSYFGLANIASYQQEELLEAYRQKNEINFQRQQQHY